MGHGIDRNDGRDWRVSPRAPARSTPWARAVIDPHGTRWTSQAHAGRAWHLTDAAIRRRAANHIGGWRFAAEIDGETPA